MNKMKKASAQAETPQIAVKKLAQLRPRVVEVSIKTPDSEEALVIPMRTLSDKEWNAIGRVVKNPPRDNNMLHPTRKDKEGQPESYFDPYHPEFQRLVGEAEDERRYRRLFASLSSVPDDYQWMSIEGEIGPIDTGADNPDDGWKAIRDNIDAGICSQLLTVLVEAGGERTVMHRSRSFQ